MITFSEDMKVWVCLEPVDMRKSINGLVVMVYESLQHEPQSKALYLFSNKGRDKVKGIIWDENGFILLYKRLEQGKFLFPKDLQENQVEIDGDLLKWLLKGFDFYRIKQFPELQYSSYF